MGMLEQTDEKPVSTGVQKRRDDEAVLLEALRDGPRSVKELQTRAYELGMLPVTTNTFRDRAKALAKKGRIHMSGGTRGNPLVFWRIDGEPRNQIEENQDVVLDATPEEIGELDA